MLPTLVLVGRPNVGKSTLFNRLTRTRDALVASYAGLTRDRQYGRGMIGDFDYVVVDTGGLADDESGVAGLMADQARQAIDEADLVLFMVDARDGRVAGDESIAKRLREQGCPCLLVANKVDGQNPDYAAGEFSALGMGAPQFISASHGTGVRQLLDQAARSMLKLPAASDGLAAVDGLAADDANEAMQAEDKPDLIANELAAGIADEAGKKSSADGLVAGRVDGSSVSRDKTDDIKIAIVGRPNVGKSTLVNRLLGENRVIMDDAAGTTRDSIYIPLERAGRHYTLIDTAGVRRRGKVTQKVEKFSVIKTLEAVADANVVILVMDAREGVVEQDLHLLGHVLDAGPALVLAVNKWDGMTQDERARVKVELDRRLRFIDFARVHFISALHGSNLGLLLDSVHQAHASATVKLPTARLNRILEQAVTAHQPPRVGRHRVKLRYAHAGGSNPPVIVIHGNQTESLPDAYKRYLANHFIKSLALKGTPVRLEFRTADNPFKGRKNKLTDRQISRRKRMLRHVKGKR